MDFFSFFIVFAALAIILYRVFTQRFATPQAIVRGLLRRYHVFERAGLPEAECLFRLLSTRRIWKKLPQSFLMEVVARLDSKENVMRFISLSEGYRFHQSRISQIARNPDIESAMAEIACMLGSLGNRLLNEGRLKNAEFVHRLALQLQPRQYFTNLPLAVTYYNLERFSEAAPLFQRGLAQLESVQVATAPAEQLALAAECLESDANHAQLKDTFRKLHEACLKGKKSANPAPKKKKKRVKPYG